jgi:hypothetical protein
MRVTTNSRPRALLDSNVWRYVVDARLGGNLVRHARTGRFEVLIAPAVVYEALRLRDAALRTSLIRLMTNPNFRRLMPEAYSESMEFLREVQRVRPDWLRAEPDLQFFQRLKNDWRKSTGGFWVRTARSPQNEANLLAQREVPIIEGARAQAKDARREMMDTEWKINRAMDKTMAAFKAPLPGWRGDEFQMWRADALTAKTYALARPGDAYRDWIAPFIELDDGLLDSAAWVEFWIYLADAGALSRQWMRWAYSFAQRFRKVTDGTPGDTQLSTYFLEADVVISADKILLEVLEEIRPYAPCPLPKGHLIPAGTAGVEVLFACLHTDTK